MFLLQAGTTSTGKASKTIATRASPPMAAVIQCMNLAVFDGVVRTAPSVRLMITASAAMAMEVAVPITQVTIPTPSHSKSENPRAQAKAVKE